MCNSANETNIMLLGTDEILLCAPTSLVKDWSNDEIIKIALLKLTGSEDAYFCSCCWKDDDAIISFNITRSCDHLFYVWPVTKDGEVTKLSIETKQK